LKGFATAEKENKDGKWCILTVFETIWNFYVKTCGCSPPLASILLLQFWVLYFIGFLEKVVGPGLQGQHVATPVGYIPSTYCYRTNNWQGDS